MRWAGLILAIGIPASALAQQSAQSVDPEIAAYRELLTEANARLAQASKQLHQASDQIQKLSADIAKKDQEKPHE